MGTMISRKAMQPGDADGLDAARRMGMQMRTLAVSRCSIFVDHLGRLPTKARTEI